MNTQIQNKSVSHTIKNIVVDSIIFIGFLLASQPHLTGLAIHEWLSLAFGGTIIVHLLLHWSWMVNVVKRIFSQLPWGTRVNALLNTLLFVALTLVIVSGIMISHSVVPTLGLNIAGGFTWKAIHGIAADGLFIGIGLHVALHWNWIMSMFKRYVLGQKPSIKAATA
jgi:hypothetical protein